MSKNFNLLLLHSKTDIHPRTWICLKGKGLKFVFKKLEKESQKAAKLTINELNNYISKKLGCSHRVTERILKNNTKFYPIPIVLELLKLIKSKKRIFERRFNQEVEYLKVNSASAKSIKAVKKLNENLAKILNINFNKVLNNVMQTDREIAEII